MDGIGVKPDPAAWDSIYAPAAGPDVKLPGVLERWQPTGPAVPVLFDTPHSGRLYPDDFGHAIDRLRLRRAEDAYVDMLVAPARSQGVTLLRALFPRAYIDPNRAADDLDPTMLAEPWPAPLNPGPKTDLGIGLIRRRVVTDDDIYDRPLTVAEVRRRIDGYHRPYHDLLQETLTTLHRRFGAVWHIDWHSMRSQSGTVSPGGPGRTQAADMVIGDLDGTACEPGFREVVIDTLRDLGYRVAVNDPYKGAEILRRSSRPAAGRHCLQIEINRGLYLDEASISPHDGFRRLVEHLTTLSAAVTDYVRVRCGMALQHHPWGRPAPATVPMATIPMAIG